MNSIIQSIIHSDKMTDVSNHYHNCYQIILIKNGTLKITYNNETVIASSENIILLNKLEQHSVKIISNEYERYVLNIDPYNSSNFENLNKQICLLFFAIIRNCRTVNIHDNINQIIYIIEQIKAEVESYKGELNDIMIEALTLQLLLIIYRYLNDSINLNSNISDIVNSIQYSFENMPYQQYTLENLAKKYNVSPSYLSHKFKELTDFSVMDYLRACRIAAAKNHLINSSMSISEVAERCGFTDLSNFSRIFKSVTGKTPSCFRSKMR